MIGKTLSHYHIVEKIGAGGMGEIYRAHDERLERDVALKVLPTGTLADESARKRFRKEALALSKLNHPNIATVFDFDTQEGVDFLVMELVEGVTLSDKLAVGPLPEKEISRLGGQMAEALEEAHERGVVHRDLKPCNVMVTPKGQAKILDFGLAKLVRPVTGTATTESFTETQGVAGTLPYMAPEQLRGEQVDARTDIHALGAVLYEMATGQRPFPETQGPRLIDAILHQAPQPPSGLNRRVSPGLENIILKALDKEPENRYQSAKELAVDLRRLGAPTATAAPWQVPRGSARWGWGLGAAGLGGRRMGRRMGRRVWPAAIALLALVAVLVGLNVGGLRERLLGRAAPGQITSIAVLPLQNLMGDPEQDYFVAGMHEALITELSKIGALTVISRTSAMRYRNTDKSVPEIARELGVDAVVEGSVLRAENTVRITAQLIEAATDRHLWADNFDREMRDILALHSDVARAIAREIKIAVTPEEAARLASVREVNPEAYRLYLLGQHHLRMWSPSGINKAIRYFQQAIALDPLYSQPHSGLAQCYGAIAFYGYIPPQQAYEKAKAMTAQALELDSNLADAHRNYAANSFFFDWHWEKAEEEFQRAIELNPNYTSAHQFYTWFLAAMGRTEEAHTTIRRALELDPLAITAYLTASDVFYFSRQYDQAITQLQELLDLSPNEPLALSRLGGSYVQKGMFKEAIGELEQAVTLSPDNTEILWVLGHAYAAAGKTAEARKVLDDLHALAKKRYVQPYAFALIHTGLGEKVEALEWLERAYQDRSGWMPFLQVEPRLDPLRSDPRFQDLLLRMNFPE